MQPIEIQLKMNETDSDMIELVIMQGNTLPRIPYVYAIVNSDMFDLETQERLRDGEIIYTTLSEDEKGE